MHWNKKKTLLSAVLAAFIIAGSILGVMFKERNTVGYINGMRVDINEFELVCDKNSGETDSCSAEEYREQIWNEICKLKVEQQLFAQYDLCKEFDYRDFLQELKNENERRKEAEENGEVYYGPRELAEDEYYDYLQSNYRIQLQQKLESQLTEDDENILESYYEKIKEKKYQKSLSGKILVVTADGMSENARETLTQLQSEFQTGMTILQFRQEYKENIDNKKMDCEEVDVSESKKKMLTPEEKRYLEKLKEMSINEAVLTETVSGPELIICTGKDEEQYYSFAEVKEDVQGEVFQENYEKMINDLAQEANGRKTARFDKLIEREIR